MKTLILTALLATMQLPAVANPFSQQDIKANNYLRSLEKLHISLVEICSYSDSFAPSKRIRVEIKCESMQRQAPAYLSLMRISTRKDEFDDYAIRLTDVFNKVVHEING